MNLVVSNLWQIKAEVEMKLGKSKSTLELDAFIEKRKLYRSFKLDDAVYTFEEELRR